MPYVLPTPEPRRRWYNDVGESQGMTANLLLKALLAQYGAGGGPMAPKDIPNPNYGQTGSLKPDISFSQPSTTGLGMTPRQNPQQIKQSIMTPSAPYAKEPMLNAQQFKYLQDFQTYNQNAAQAPYDLAAKQANAQLAGAKTSQINWAMKNGLIPIQNPITGEITFQQVGSDQSSQPKSSFYQNGDIVQRGTKRFRIVGLDSDGTPLVEPE